MRFRFLLCDKVIPNISSSTLLSIIVINSAVSFEEKRSLHISTVFATVLHTQLSGDFIYTVKTVGFAVKNSCLH